MKQLSLLILLFLSLSLGLLSCASEEGDMNQLEECSKLNPTIIDNLYNKYLDQVKEEFPMQFSLILPGNTRSGWTTDPREFAEYITGLSNRELLKLLYDLQSEYEVYENFVTKRWSEFIDNVNDEDLVVLNEFVKTYPLSDNKKNMLYKVAGNYQNNSFMGNTIIATAARLDYVQAPIAEVILEHERVIVIGAEYLKDCEHALIRDLAELCLEDVVVEMTGGGPEDPYADVTVSIGDIYGGIKAYLDYIDCKDKIK